jgi:hypothetical protein
VLLGFSAVVQAQSEVVESAPPVEWPMAKKSYVFPVPTPTSVVPEQGEPSGLKPSKHPNSIVWSNTEEFFNRPVQFNQPVDPVKTSQWLWFDAEYLLWWTKNGPLPVPLVTTGSAPVGFGNDVPMVINGTGIGGGVLGDPDTSVRFGGEGLDYGAFSGGRFAGGFWCDCQCCWSVSLGGFFLEDRSERYFATAASNGTPVLARPFFDPATGVESSLLVSSPGAYEGSIAVQSSSQLLGLELNVRRDLRPDFGRNVILLAGLRYLDLDEDLVVIQRTQELDDGRAFFNGLPITKAAVINLFDSFSTVNQFFGGQVGAESQWNYGDFFLTTGAKVALGGNRTKFNNAGLSRLDRGLNLSDDFEPGGFLVQLSNAGEYTRSCFSAVGELNVKLGYQVCTSCRVSVGYDFLYWTQVARPGDQIDRVINSNAIPVSQTYQDAGGQGRPLPRFERSDFWAQGFNVGAEFRY